MAEANHQFGNISIGSRGGWSQGQLKLTSQGLVWRRSHGSKAIDVPRKDMDGLIWTKLGRGCQLAVRRHKDFTLTFQGFRDQDLEVLREMSHELNQVLQEEAHAISGRNWGELATEGSSLVFHVDGKPAFRVPLPECGQVNHGKDEVLLEFPVDDTLGSEREDALVEMTFYTPKDNPDYPANEETPVSKVLFDKVMQFADVDEGVGEAVATFDTIGVVHPRGRFDCEMYSSFMKLIGQGQDYRIQYSHIVRLFLLPKSNSPHTLVVISLDPPIRKGATYYPHVLAQFPTDEEIEINLDISEELLKAKNEKCGGKLTPTLTGGAADVFARALRGLSGSKLTRPGTFRTADDAGHAVRCSYKADDGYIYPLERAFFYVGKPPLLVPHDDVESVEFLRQGGGVLAASAKTFDLNIRLRSEQEYLFRGIQKSEWSNLFDFINAKHLHIVNLKETELGPGGGGAGRALDLDMGDDIDTGKAQMQARGELDSDSEEDEDFEAGSEPESEEEDDEDDSASGGEEAPARSEKKRPASAKKERPPSAVKRAKKEAPVGADDSGGKKKKPRKKKDKNAPKRGMTAFMLFSQAMRTKVKEEQPNLTFGEIGKALGERWKALSAEDKEQYNEQAKADKARYEDEMKAYKQAGGGEDANGNENDDADSE